MRIGIEAQRIFRPKKHGMDIVILEVLRRLRAMEGSDCYFVYAQPDADMDALKEGNQIKIKLSGPASYPVWEQRHLPAMATADKVDLLHCTSNTAPVGLKIPLVVTIHDIIYLEKLMLTGGTWYQKLGNIYRRWNVPLIAKHASVVITVSEYERERIIERLKLPAERVRTVYNACGTHFTSERNTEELEAFRKKMNLPQRFVLFLGNTDPKKNLPNVMKALGILKSRGKLNFKLVMPDIGGDYLKRLLATQGNTALLEDIVLTGYIPNKELPNLYKLADIFLYPSLRESFGIPIIEAMACGTPLITSNTSAMPEIAGSGALLIDPFNPEAIAEMILQVEENSNLRQQSVTYGLKRAQFFSWQKTAEQVLEIYREVLYK
jgi:glycosyltransferase involved in cell wall biosynthesis